MMAIEWMDVATTCENLPKMAAANDERPVDSTI